MSTLHRNFYVISSQVLIEMEVRYWYQTRKLATEINRPILTWCIHRKIMTIYELITTWEKLYRKPEPVWKNLIMVFEN